MNTAEVWKETKKVEAICNCWKSCCLHEKYKQSHDISASMRFLCNQRRLRVRKCLKFLPFVFISEGMQQTLDADTLFYSFGNNLTSLAGNENIFFSKTKQVSPQNCYKHTKRLFLMQIWCSSSWLDMLQVDLLARGASLFWPWSGRPRATKSREVVRAIWNPTKDFLESLRLGGSSWV